MEDEPDESRDVRDIKTAVPWAGNNRIGAARAAHAIGRPSALYVGCAGGIPELDELRNIPSTLVLNDKHRHLINLYCVLADKVLKEKLRSAIDAQLFHEDVLAAAQDRCRKQEQFFELDRGGLFKVDMPAVGSLGWEPSLQWAIDYYTVCWFSRSSIAGTPDEFNSNLPIRWDGAGGGDSAKRARSATLTINKWHKILYGSNCSCIDLFEFLVKIGDEAGNCIYVDPPFRVKTIKYRYDFEIRDHDRLASALFRFQKTHVVIRYYDHPHIRKIYPADRWLWFTFEGRKQTNETAPEVLIVGNRSAECFSAVDFNGLIPDTVRENLPAGDMLPADESPPR